MKIVPETDVPEIIGNLSVLDLKTEYRSKKEDPVSDFFEPCLLHSTKYKRAVGFFRSTVFAVTGSSIIDFSKRGGRTQLICSPELTMEDIQSISEGYAEKSELLADNLVQQIDLLMSSSESIVFCTRILATLIKVNALEIQIAIRSDRKGFYHEKIGVFSDNFQNSVTFKGSSNETWHGWHPEGNIESIEVFCSWRGGLEARRVINHLNHFDTLWMRRDKDIEVFSFPSYAMKHLEKVAFDSLDNLESKSTILPTPNRVPLTHQREAIDTWSERGCRGIFQHATGSGKTFTAILAIKQHITLGNPVLVVVPSKLLLIQWSTELKKEISNVILLLAGGGNSSWKVSQKLEGMTSAESFSNGRIVLATMQTASKGKFRNSVVHGDHLFLVADEVHQIGSPQYSQILEIDAGKRLGLSATPSRYGDPEGTRKIFEYFEGVIPPVITLSDAIQAKRLVPYEYYPHTVNLNAEEVEEWRTMTKKIGHEIARRRSNEIDTPSLSTYAQMLLIQRARIAKKATEKLQLACRILRDNYCDDQNWLIYCEDIEQLNQVMLALRKVGMNPVEYHTGSDGDQPATISWIRLPRGICVAIRCLDEGVDIPNLTHALVLASSQNPRQFIQRRGRVLRRSKDKHIAVIHDAIVVPVDLENEPEQSGLLHCELARALEFADNAINKGASAELRNIAIRMNIDPEELQKYGIED